MKNSLASDTPFQEGSLPKLLQIKNKSSNVKMYQTRLPIDWIVEAEESSSSSEEYEEEVKRGRPVQPLQWTRVKSLKLIKEQKLMVYDGTKDLAFDKNLKVIRKQAKVDGGEFVFDPDSLKEEAKTFSVEGSRLSQDELLEYGKLAT